jgi:hypothetical protein
MQNQVNRKRSSSPQSMHGFKNRRIPKAKESYKQDLDLCRPIIINGLLREISRRQLLEKLTKGDEIIELMDKSSIGDLLKDYLTKYYISTEMLKCEMNEISKVNRELECEWAFSDKPCSEKYKELKENLRDEYWWSYVFGKK